MADQHDKHLDDIRRVMARYLDAALTFDQAVTEVARSLRLSAQDSEMDEEAEHAAEPRPVGPTKPFSLDDWMRAIPTESYTLTPIVLAPGRSREDEARAAEVWAAAFARVSPNTPPN
jgi:hypothetical protein